uniref:VWFC domain-containing protein n=1 Tax=Psorophora albipes TaxID=869069 RepID=T1DIB8_9DIPT
MNSIGEMKLIIIMSTLLLAVSIEISADENKCRNVTCPRPAACPLDSYPKTVTKHYSPIHHPRSNTKEIIRHNRSIEDYQQQNKSVNKKASSYNHYRQKRITTNDEILLQLCCPQQECVCKPNYCDQACPPDKIPINNTYPTDNNDLQLGVPGNCCISCKNNYCMHHHKFYMHGEKWRGDDCTTCECEYGEIKCQLPLCNPPSCLTYKQVPGECCPICDDDATNFCKDVRYCNIHCKYGYKKRGSCELCECTRNYINQTSFHPEIETSNRESSLENANNNVKAGPHQEHTAKNDIYLVCIFIIFGITVTAMILIVWYRFYGSAKYSTVQIA